MDGYENSGGGWETGFSINPLEPVTNWIINCLVSYWDVLQLLTVNIWNILC
jgi:hypothetical protein